MSVGSLPLGTLMPLTGLPAQDSSSSQTSGSGSTTLQAIENDLMLDLLGASGAQTKSSNSHLVAQIVTGLLGVLLIAAAIFTHPTVINVGKKTARAAGRAAELVAA